MIERLAIVLFLSLAAMAVYHVLRNAHLRRMRPVAIDTGQPRLLYFRSETCGVCPTQSRIIEGLTGQFGGRLRVETVDVQHDPDMAARYGVFSLPTTILIDGGGRVRQINYGLADASKLGRQLSALLESEIESAPPLTSVSEAA